MKPTGISSTMDGTTSHESDLVISAARQGDAPQLKELLERGLNYNASNYKDETPLHVAAREGHLECVEILLKAAWKEFSSEDSVDFVCLRGSALSVAAKNGHGNIVEALVKLHSGCSAEKSGFALHKACKTSKVKCIEILVKSLPEHLKEKDCDGLLPIHIAAKCCSTDGMKILLDGGADLSARTITWQATPLHIACKAGNTDVVNFLIEKNVDINANETCGSTPLLYAATWNHLDVLQILLSHGATPCSFHGEDGASCPITKAAGLGNFEVVKMLANIAKHECGAEAIVNAMVNGMNECLEYLLKSGFPTIGTSEDRIVAKLWMFMMVTQSKEDSPRTLEILLEHDIPFHELAKYDSTSELSIFPNKLYLLPIDFLRTFLNYGLAELQWGSQSQCNFIKLVKETINSFLNPEIADEWDYFDPDDDEFLSHEEFLLKHVLYQKYLPYIKFSCEDSSSLSDIDIWHERFVPAVGTLTEICRWTIRCSIVKVHSSIMGKHVSRLTLPSSLKNYVLYKNDNRS